MQNGHFATGHVVNHVGKLVAVLGFHLGKHYDPRVRKEEEALENECTCVFDRIILKGSKLEIELATQFMKGLQIEALEKLAQDLEV